MESFDKTLEKLHFYLLETLREFQRVCDKNDIHYFVAYGSLLGTVRHKGFIPWDPDVDVWITRDNYQKLCNHKDEFGEAYELLRPEDYLPDKFYNSTPRISYKYVYNNVNLELNRFYQNKNNRLHIDLFVIDKTYSDIRGTFQRYELCFLYGLMGAYRSKAYNTSGWPLIQRFAQACMNLVGRFIPLAWLLKRAEKVAGRYNAKDDADIYRDSTDSYVNMKRRFPKETLAGTIMMDFKDMQVPVPQDYDTILKLIYGDYMKLPPVEERVMHLGDWTNLKSTKVEPNNFIFEAPKEDTK